MAGALRFLIGLLLIAHGFVHLLYVVDDVPEFSLDGSWLVPDALRRPFATVMMGGTIAAFSLLGLAVWGVPGLASIWPALAVVGASLSLLLLVVFWSWSLVFGVLIDVVVIAIAVARPEFTDRIAG